MLSWRKLSATANPTPEMRMHAIPAKIVPTLLSLFLYSGHPQCGQPEQPIYGTVKIAGEFGHYSCIPGYTMRGNATRRCSWKGWEGQVPECTGTPRCGTGFKEGFLPMMNSCTVWGNNMSRSKEFVKCFLRVPQAVGLCAAAMLACCPCKQWELAKTYYIKP